MRTRMACGIWLLLFGSLAGAPAASAQPIEVAVSGAPDSSELAVSVRKLARAALSRVTDAATEEELLDRAILHLDAGDPAAALGAIERLRRTVEPSDPGYAPFQGMTHELAARARRAQETSGRSFEDELGRAFRDVFGRLDDLAANHAAWYFGASIDRARTDLLASLDGAAGKTALDLDEAVRLAARYGTYVTLRDVLPVALPL